MLNMLQKGAYQSWKFLQKQTLRSSKRSQFYSSSMKILKPKRTVEFKKTTNLNNQKRWKKITISTLNNINDKFKFVLLSFQKYKENQKLFLSLLRGFFHGRRSTTPSLLRCWNFNQDIFLVVTGISTSLTWSCLKLFQLLMMTGCWQELDHHVIHSLIKTRVKFKNKRLTDKIKFNTNYLCLPRENFLTWATYHTRDFQIALS